MKKLKFITLILTIALVAISCETYDDYDTDRATVIGFARKSQNINSVPEGGTKEQALDVFVSDVSNNDRTFDIIVVPIADPVTNIPTGSENYTFDASVTIPANERIGTMIFTAIDVTLTKDRTFVMLGIKEGPDHISGGQIMVGLKN